MTVMDMMHGTRTANTPAKQFAPRPLASRWVPWSIRKTSSLGF